MRRSITLAMDDGPYEIEADVFGDWAVHQGPTWVHGLGKSRPAWTITHVPSGMRASCSETVGMTKREAFKIARHLAKQAFPAQPNKEMGRAVYREILCALGLTEIVP